MIARKEHSRAAVVAFESYADRVAATHGEFRPVEGFILSKGESISRRESHAHAYNTRGFATACRRLALQLLFLKTSESMGNHDSEIVDAGSVD